MTISQTPSSSIMNP